MIAILIVCSANICRSPLAQGVLEKLVVEQGLQHQVTVDSAGTHVFKSGHRPDKRAQQMADKTGANIKKLKARMVKADDFLRFDYILAMDLENLRSLEAICPEEYRNKLHLMMEFASQSDSNEVPDPYFGNLLGFERVLGLLDMGCKGFLSYLRIQYRLAP